VVAGAPQPPHASGIPPIRGLLVSGPLAEEALIPRVMRARRREDVLATVGEFTLQPPKHKGPLGVIAPMNGRLLCVLIR
jgi:hypothetical protein